MQGVNDTAVFLTMAVSSVASGALFSYQGWQMMNALALPFVALGAAGVVWLGITRRSVRRAA